MKSSGDRTLPCLTAVDHPLTGLTAVLFDGCWLLIALIDFREILYSNLLKAFQCVSMVTRLNAFLRSNSAMYLAIPYFHDFSRIILRN